MTADLERLKALALAAGTSWYVAGDIGNVLDLVTEADNNFVIAANPAAVLAMIQRIEGMEATADMTCERLERATAQVSALLAERNILIIERNNALLRAIKAENPPAALVGVKTRAGDYDVDPNDPLDDVLSLQRYDPTLMDRIPVEVIAAANLLTQWDAENNNGKGWRIAGVCNEAWANRKAAERDRQDRIQRLRLHLNLPASLDLPDTEGGSHD